MKKTLIAIILILLISSNASALVGTFQDIFRASVSEQANVTVPASITFNVTNVSTSTASSSQTVTVTTIVLASSKALRIEMQADAASFTAATGGAVTWAATDISWNTATWTNGTGASGSLSSASYTKLNDTDVSATSTSTSDLVFTLAGKSTVDRAGNHTLTTTWKFSSF